MIKEFRKFILRGNIVELVIGFTVGAAFSSVARSVVNDIIMPPISLFLGKSDFSNLYFLLKEGRTPAPYQSLSAAQDAGAVTINYGNFLNNLLSLTLVALAMFVIIKAVNKVETELEELAGRKSGKKEGQPANKKCPFCFSTIDYQATRCPNCTSQLPQSKNSKK